MATHTSIRLDGDTVDPRSRAVSSARPTPSPSASGPRKRFACARRATRSPDGHNRLTGVVRDASYLGVSTQYQVEAPWRRAR